MNVDPSTEVQRLIAAFPGAVGVLRRLGLEVDSEETLEQACRKAGISLADVQAALTSIDWTRAGDSGSTD